MLVDAAFLVFGIGLLYLGGEGLVAGASALAERLGVSTLLIGLTVVAFGTSAPELAATMTATYDGAPDLGLGNVVGSNIANIGLILGVSALLIPLHTTTRFIRRELAFMIACSVLMLPVLHDGVITRIEGLVLTAVLLGYLGFLYRAGQDPSDHSTQTMATLDEDSLDDEEDAPSPGKAITMVLIGGVLLVLGAKSLVIGAVAIAEDLGISERVIGLSMVAVGTSLPELASSLIAVRKGDSDMVLGNVVGSNVFNVLCILGFTATAMPMHVDGAAAATDLYAMLALSVAVPILLWKGRRMGRIEGGGLLLLWCLYLGSLVVRLPTFG